VNDTFQIKLLECIACDYYWSWINSSQVTIMDSIYSTYVSYAAPGTKGGEGAYFWNFKGLKTGVDTIKLINGQPLNTNTYDTSYVIVKIVDSDYTATNYTISLNDSIQFNFVSNPSRAHKQWQGLYGYLAFNPASSFGVV
jgi:hypothetical protein